MTPRDLRSRYRVFAIDFFESEHGRDWCGRLGDRRNDVTDLLTQLFGADLALLPEELDREHLTQLMTVILPGRLGGKEPFREQLPELMEQFVGFLAEAAGVAREWEWRSAIANARGAYEQALANPSRSRLAAPRREPDRRPAAKVGRNDPCPCGSGKKYKRCCLNLI